MKIVDNIKLMILMSKTGKTIEFGGYNWQIIDKQKNKILIIAESSIGSRRFDETSNIWRDCELRDYLNCEFYNSFSEVDRAKILKISNKNPKNLWFKYSAGTDLDTDDYIFLLDIEGADKYFGNSGDYLSQRKKEGNGNESINGVYIYNSYNKARVIKRFTGTQPPSWWLRSNGGSHRTLAQGKYVALVDNFGKINVGCNRPYESHGVRPALWMSL